MLIRQHFRNVFRFTLYPVYLFGSLGFGVVAILLKWPYSVTYGWITALTIVSMAILEHLLPLDRRWSMTWASFKRDLKYIASGIMVMAGARMLGPFLALYLAIDGSGPAHNLQLIPAVLALLLGYEFFQYWYHRLSHELSGSVGLFLWRVHAAHHLPDRVYIMMHAVGHPLNFIVVRWLIYTAVIYLLGFSAEAVLLMSIIMGVSGAFSHFNMDIRAGWLNYLLIGTELHRYHHSADPTEAKNYGAITPFWDLVFGTFVYKLGEHPMRLGVERPDLYPQSNEFWKVVRLPFRT